MDIEKKNKVLTVWLIITSVLLLLSLSFIVLIYVYNISLDANTGEDTIYAPKVDIPSIEIPEGDGVYITEVIEGNANIQENSCNDSNGCIVDLLVRIDEREYTFENIQIGRNINVYDRVQNNLEGEDKFFILDWGTGNERGNYIFNRDTISTSFCSVGEDPILWKDNLVYNSCSGSAGQYIELVSSISILNISSGDITDVFVGVNEDDIDKSYFATSIQEDILEYRVCEYNIDGEVGCTNSTVDLNDYL